jgi:hypothetical protein
MEMIRSCEALIHEQTTRRCISEDDNFQVAFRYKKGTTFALLLSTVELAIGQFKVSIACL